ncbi:MAG: DUF11 domain-containing protein [Mariniphaga sp.]|nr:DUF11 domain-containing protein [Mariniphaga sp.]
MKIINAILITLILLVPAQAQDDGLVAEWHFDEGFGNVLKDSSGNGNDGTIYGATWVEGKYGQALSFDGVNDYVEVPDSPELSGGGKSLTVEAWVKPESVSQHTVIGKYRDISSKDWGINILRNKLHFQYEFKGNNYDSFYGNSILNTNVWYHVAFVYSYTDKTTILYLNGMNDGMRTLPTDLPDTDTPVQIGRIGGSYGSIHHFKGLIDEIKISNRALSAEEIKSNYEQGPTALSIIKTVSPQSIKQDQTTTITLTVKNTGSNEINDIEIADTIPRDLTFIDGETSKTYASLSPQDSRQIQYEVQLYEVGTFNLEPAVASYLDDKGNYKTIKSKPASIEVIPSLVTDYNQQTSKKSSSNVQSASVNLHGEKTDVALGEDVLLKLSAVNIIGNPTMHVQVIIIPPSGWSVTSSEFAKSGAGQYTTTYELEPGGGKDIEVRIVPNQIGDEFQVDGRIIYYFGNDVETREDHTLSLSITVRAQADQTANNPQSTDTKSPGFAFITGFVGFVAAILLINKKMRY